MNTSHQPLIHIKNLEQIGMVVHNLQNSMEKLWETFGIGPWNIYVYEPSDLKEVYFRGKPSNSGMKIARSKVGQCEIELIEPVGEDNAYQEFLNEHEEGIEHLGWHLLNSETEFFETVERLKNAGFPCLWSGHSPLGRFAYMDTRSVLNTVLEVVWAKGDTTGKPDFTYPEQA